MPIACGKERSVRAEYIAKAEKALEGARADEAAALAGYLETVVASTAARETLAIPWEELVYGLKVRTDSPMRLRARSPSMSAPPAGNRRPRS